MAAKGGTTQVAAAAGVAAATGAAQLGLGYGLGVVVWPVTAAGDDSVWLGSLGWATWIAASSTVFGAMIAAALRGARPSGPLRLALAFFAGVGALLTVALVALPARTAAVRADAAVPERIAATYALIGILLGVIIAYWAVVSAPVATNLIATSAYLWALASTAIVVELTAGRPAATYLTSWQFAEIAEDSRYGTIYWPSALITLVAAFLLGALAAWPAARRGNLGVGTAASGAVGPALVGAAFLLLAPQLTGALGQLQSAYLIAPYAVLAGLAGSALVVTTAQRRTAAAPSPAEATTQRRATPASRPAEASDDDDDDWGPTDPRTSRRGSSTRRPAAAGRAGDTPDDTRRPGTDRPSGDRVVAVRADVGRPGTVASPQRDPAPASQGGRGGLFGRRKSAEPDEPTLDLAASPPEPAKKPRGGLFGRRKSTDEPTADLGTAAAHPATEQSRPRLVPAAAAAESRPADPWAASAGGSSAGGSPADGVRESSAPGTSAAGNGGSAPAGKDQGSKPAGDRTQAETKAAPNKAAEPAKPTPAARPRKAAATRTKQDPDDKPTPSRTRKSTVAAPPTSPPIAKINPQRDPEDN